MSEEIICKIDNIVKQFPGTMALDHVSFNVKRGEVHAIVGENGAGKSTLMNILSGVFPPPEGTVTFNGKECHFSSPSEAEQAGIAMIHQELSLSPTMTAAENVYMNRMPVNKLGLVNYKKMYADCAALLEKLGVSYISPKAKVRNLSVSEQQLLEICKAVSCNAQMLIMDEPTSSLTDTEVKFLLNIVNQLREEGISILYISHKLEEILTIADTITVLRDGQHIATEPAAGMTEQHMVSLMVGREYEGSHKRNFVTDYSGKTPILSVRNLYDMAGKVKNVSFDLYPGEVLGLTGLVGAGRSETLQCIFGANMRKSGQIFINGEEVNIKNCDDAIKRGIGMIPEGRKIQGLFLKMTVRENILLVYQRCMAKGGILNTKKLLGDAEEYSKKLNVKTASIDAPITSLSGGNQQKTIIDRWLMNKPTILFMDEPTHGIDIGAKNEIYKLIDDLTKQGLSIVLISSEMPEVLSLCDRIIFMHHGYKRGELNNADASQEKLMSFTLDSAMTEDEKKERAMSDAG